MRRMLTLVLGLGIVAQAGCIIRPAHHGHTYRCGPAYHWNGERCVHNGHGHDKSNKSNRDHRH